MATSGKSLRSLIEKARSLLPDVDEASDLWSPETEPVEPKTAQRLRGSTLARQGQLSHPAGTAASKPDTTQKPCPPGFMRKRTGECVPGIRGVVKR